MFCDLSHGVVPAETHGTGQTRYVHIDSSVAEAFGVGKRKHIFFPVREPFKHADDTVLAQLEQSILDDVDFEASIPCSTSGEDAEMLVCSVSVTSLAHHSFLPEHHAPVPEALQVSCRCVLMCMAWRAIRCRCFAFCCGWQRALHAA